MTLILDKHAPLKTVTVTPRNKNPWFTSNLLTERRKRRQLERTWRNSHNEADRLLCKKNVICTIPLLRKPSLITLRLYSKTASIQNFCGVQSTKFVIALAHPH